MWKAYEKKSTKYKSKRMRKENTMMGDELKTVTCQLAKKKT